MTRSLLVVAFVALSACPPQIPDPDGGNPDGGQNPDPKDACTGGCAVNQKCDVMARVCRDGCDGTCDGGTICQRVRESEFSCTAITTSCGGQMCETGEVACLGGSCSCL